MGSYSKIHHQIVGNLKNVTEHFNIFVFFMKISCQSEESPSFLTIPLYSPIPPFLEKSLIPPLLPN